MAVVKSQFIREFDNIQMRLNRLCGSGLSLQVSAPDAVLGDWPPSEEQETAQNYLIKVYCPDVTPADVILTLQDRVLTIEGERSHDERSPGFGTVASTASRFVRRFTLPIDVEAPQVHAELNDGVLSIYLPKMPKPIAQPVHVRVVQGSRP